MGDTDTDTSTQAPARRKRGRPTEPGSKRSRAAARRLELAASGKIPDRNGQYRGSMTSYRLGRAQPVLQALREGLTLSQAAERSGLSLPTVAGWMVNKPEFTEMVTAARSAAALNMPDQARLILQDAEDRLETIDRRLASAMVMSARNRADLLMRCAGIYNRRMSEKYYLHGGDDGGPIRVDIRMFAVAPVHAHLDGTAEIIEAKPVHEGAQPSVLSINSKN